MKWTIIVPSELGIDKPNQVLSQCASTFISTIAWSKWCETKIFAGKLPSIHSNTAHTLMKSTLQGASHTLETKKQVSDDESCILWGRVPRRKTVCACASTRRRYGFVYLPLYTVPYYLLDGIFFDNCHAHHNNFNSFWIRLQFCKKYNVI